MPDPLRPAELVGASLDSLKRYETTRETLAENAARPSSPGDLHALPGVGVEGVEWAVLRRDPEDARRVLVAPADANPCAGSADVALKDSPDAGPLVLRCRFATWIDAALLDPASRTGALSARDLARARGVALGLAGGKDTGSARTRGIDHDPEYLGWLEGVVRPAVEALTKNLEKKRSS